MSTASSDGPFVFESVYEYDNNITGDGKRRISGHYRTYTDNGDYLGYIIRRDGHPRLRWTATVPNPRYIAVQGPGFIDGRYIGRHANPRMITRHGETRADVANVLRRHYAEHPQHRVVEARPICERVEALV